MDLTIQFTHICRLVEEEYQISHKPRLKNELVRQEEQDFNTNFIKDAVQLNKMIVEFEMEIINIRPKYLLMDQNQADEEEKDSIDEQSSIYVTRLKKLYELLEKTNKDKDEIDAKRLTRKFIVGQDWKIYMETMIVIRGSILQYLLQNLIKSTKNLSEMKQIRLNKKKQLSSLSQYTTRVHNIPIIEDEQQQEKEHKTQYTQEQLQILEQENHDLLISNKEETLREIAKLEKTAHEVITLQNELTYILNLQEQQIDNIIENSEHITIDLKLSNKQLIKLESSFSDHGNYLMYILILSGICILIIDYIKP